MAETQASKDKTKARMKQWREANKERIKAYQKEWNAKNAEHVAEYQKAYMQDYKSKPDAQFATWVRNLQRNYSMTPEHFNILWKQQDGKCAVCSVALLPRGRTSESACVDHNHLTGEVRGLLCRACNHGIGNLKDCPDVLEAAAKYLRDRGNYSSLRKDHGK